MVVGLFRRLADIHEFSAAMAPEVDVSALTGHEAVPQVTVFEFDGERRKSLEWSYHGTVTSASPVLSHALGVARDVPTPDLLLRNPGQTRRRLAIRSVHKGLVESLRAPRAFPGHPTVGRSRRARALQALGRT